MRLSKSRERELLLHAQRHPDDHLTFPREIYRPDGSLIVHRDGVQERLHRRLYRLATGVNLGRMKLERACEVWGCQSPSHYVLLADRLETRSHARCPNGHLYTEVGATPAGHCAACDLIRQARRRERRPDGGALNRAKETCPAGHPYDAANTYWQRTESGFRRKCRACNRAKVARTRSGIT